MMEAVFEDFEVRVAEIESYFRLLATLEEPDVRLLRSERSRRIDPSWVKTLKASAFLILYNLVESSMRRGMAALYESIKTDGKSYAQLTEQLRTVWIEQCHRRIDLFSASPRKYEENAKELVERASQQLVVELDAGLLPMSGNLDADRVRKICFRHGICVRTHYRAQGGSELIVVLQQRNSLGHGDSSFAECGRSYAVHDLIRIKKQVVVFMRSILRSIEGYIAKRAYAVA